MNQKNNIKDFIKCPQCRNLTLNVNDYINGIMLCPSCIKANTKKHIVEKTIKETEQEEFDRIPKWIIKTLQEHGNCYVAKLGIKLQYLELACGFKLKMRSATSFGVFAIIYFILSRT